MTETTPTPRGSDCPTDPELLLALDGLAEHLRPHLDTCAECGRRLVLLRHDPELTSSVGPPSDPAPYPAGGPEPPHRPAAPAELGGYRIVRELGRGGMGVVYEATDPTLGRRLAVKVVRPESAARPESRARFLREARALAAVEHDHVVPILHYGVEGGVPYLVMPLLRGETLARRLKREGALPPAEVVRVGREVAAGLAAVHAADLIHRDLKPGNVWLDAETGRARLLDFGLASGGPEVEDPTGGVRTEEGVLVGSPSYMAPEQLVRRDVDGRADLFALGAVLYECATGRRAFPGETLTAVLAAVATLDPTPPAEVNPTVPPGLSDLILRLLAKLPSGRPPSAAEANRALGLLQVDAPSTPRRSRRRVGAVAAALAVSAALVLALVLGRPGPDTRPAAQDPGPVARPPAPPGPASYRGRVDVKVSRPVGGRPKYLRLNQHGSLPMGRDDEFRIEARVSPPAYLYVVWVEPGRDVVPVYPWDPEKAWGSRPAREEPVGEVRLPPDPDLVYYAKKARPGVATVVAFARPIPLDAPDAEVERWFKELPELALPPGEESAAVWFENFAEVTEPDWERTFGVKKVDDPFARWQSGLRASLGGRVSFQAAVSFARADGNR